MSGNDKKLDEIEVKNFYNELMEDDDHYGVTSHHNGWAGNFHRYRLDFLSEIFINYLNVTSETEILDVGSSMSILAEIFSIEECPQIAAFDISQVVIDKAKKEYPYINFSVDNAQNPSIEGEWDILHAGEIIEHLPDPKEALKNWNKLIKKGGVLILSTPNGTVSRKTEEHISLLSVNKLKGLLKDEGFELIDVLGIDLFIPAFNTIWDSLMMKRFPSLSNSLYSKKMSIVRNNPKFAYDIVYIAKKL